MFSMRTILKTSLALLTAATAALAGAQDWGTYQGQNSRTGTNGDVVNSGPGRAFIRWFYPNAFEARASAILRNNTSSEASSTGAWSGPATIDEAGDPFIPFNNSGPQVGVETLGPAGGQPAYAYNGTTASQARILNQPYDPRIPAVGAANTWTWQLTPPAGDIGTQRNYSLYVWVPQGPTANALFPQQFFVYDIQYGNGQHYVDVVNVWQSGWIRLGNGGNPTSRTFPYNGVNPITITLFNTVPRDENGQLTDFNPANRGQVRPNGVVYADAALAIPDFGAYVATPTVRLNPNIPALMAPTRTVAAFNRFVADTGADASSGLASQVSAGEVSSYDHASGARQWKFTLANLRTVSVAVDNTNATPAPALAWTAVTSPAAHQGADYYRLALQSANLATAASVTYSPNVAPGSYDVEVYLPGPYDPTQPAGDTGDNVGHGTVVKIFEGIVETDVTVDQTQGPGWFKIGGRKFAHSGAAPLTVAVTNYTTDATDVPNGRFAYADAVRFSTQIVPAVNSTPVQATVNVLYDPTNPTVIPALPQAVDVVVVAAEDGRLYCLDGKGNGDGTTNLIWAYPSLPDATNPGWFDPNTNVLSTAPIASKLDGETTALGTQGTILAEMPNGFNTSSALIRRNGVGEDLLYVGATNGRVYCIEMVGRGDENVTTGKAGTTKRRWTFPDDYPSIKKPALGPFFGSVAFATTTLGDTIFAPDSQGRMYALDADGTAATRVTTTRWAFPALNQRVLGSIRTTPVVAFNPQRVYFGTMAPDDTQPGQAWCVDAANPTNAGLQWVRTAVTIPGPVNLPYDDFLSTPAAATAAELTNGMPDTVFFANMNQYVVAYSADGNQLWETNELGNTVRAPLSVTYLNVFDNTGFLDLANARPIVMVPTSANQYSGLFADQVDTNRFGGKLAYEYDGEGGNQLAALSVGRNFMYSGDGGGNLYAWDNSGASLGGYGTPPGFPVIVPNDPDGDALRNNIKIKVLKPAGVKLLLERPTTATYNDIDSDPGSVYTDPLRNPLAFEWGEHAQLVIYGFPDTFNGGMPRVQFTITVLGKDGRPRVVEGRSFVAGSAPAGQEAYAVIDIPVQGTGPDGVPPGPGRITFNLRANSSSGTESIVAMDPTKNFRDFFIANPIGIGMTLDNASLDVASSVTASRSMGKSTNPSNPENLVNGSPDVVGKTGSTIATSPGMVNHGNSGLTTNFVWDRSLMTQLRGPGRGLDSIRAQSGDLAWVGQQASVFKQLGATYALFEDYPNNFPNTSLDYPNILRDRMHVTKDPNGTPENPFFGPISLASPFIPTDALGNPIPANRTMTAVPLQWQLDVPKYQPSPVGVPAFVESGGSNLPSGYSTRIRIFVDSNGNSVYDTGTGVREAMRSFFYTMGVVPDQRLVVTTPTVDLGSLATGTGFTTGVPGSNSSSFNPRNPAWSAMFQPFTVTNEGNVNAVNVRVAKGTVVNGGQFNPWPLFGTSTDDLAYLNGGQYLLSDLDRNSLSTYNGADSGLVPTGSFKLTPTSILQKPRVNDPSGTTLTTNPVARVNPNLGVIAQTPLLDPGIFPVQNPRVAVVLPLGFPSGSFTNILRIIEDDNDDEALALDGNYNGLEPYTDPTLTLKFRIREARITSTPTKQARTSTAPISPADPLRMMTAPMVDNLQPITAPASNYQYGNTEPAGIRLLDGTLLMAWSSNRPIDNPAEPTTASANDQWRLYVASVAGVSPTSTPGFTPLRDLDAWIPASGAQWFFKSGSTNNGYPTVNNALFNVQAGETLITETAKFGNPAFPIQGLNYATNTLRPSYMAFTGTAQKTTSSGRIAECRLFITTVSVSNGQATLGAPVSMPYDLSSLKSKPFIIQDGPNAVIFYSASTTAGGQLMWTSFDGTAFTKPSAVPLPSGFESAETPSVTVRPYTGGAPLLDGNGVPMTDVFDVSFTGRVRGRSASEVYTVRLGTGSATIVPQSELYQPQISRETLIADAGLGGFRAVGQGWNPIAAIAPGITEALLEQWVDINRNGVQEANEVQNLEVPNTRVVDRTTGIMTFDCKLGGKVYLDPNLGSVRFTSAGPARNGQIYLSYQPTVLRISTNTTSSYTGSTLMFDRRLTSLSVDGNNLRTGLYGPDYWGRNDNTPAQSGDAIANDRYIAMYSRGASGSGNTARPFMKTMRYGVQLPSAIYARPDGSLLNPPGNAGASITVAGLAAGDFYQVDPAKGRIYFSKSVEGKFVTINYTALNNAGQYQMGASFPHLVTLITETEEAAVPIEGAANDANIAPFMDPFDPGGSLNNRRPGLVWMFWSSNRSGNTDVYMQTLAPRYAPVIGGH